MSTPTSEQSLTMELSAATNFNASAVTECPKQATYDRVQRWLEAQAGATSDASLNPLLHLNRVTRRVDVHRPRPDRFAQGGKKKIVLPISGAFGRYRSLVTDRRPSSDATPPSQDGDGGGVAMPGTPETLPALRPSRTSLPFATLMPLGGAAANASKMTRTELASMDEAALAEAAGRLFLPAVGSPVALRVRIFNAQAMADTAADRG